MEPLSLVIGLCITQICWSIAEKIDTNIRIRREHSIIMSELKKLKGQISRLDMNKQTTE